MHDIRTASHQDLNEFANLIADQIRGRVIPRDMALGALHAAALELNRRHGNASLQARRDVLPAIETLEQIDHLTDGLCGDEDIDWSAVKLARTRAFGVLLDQLPASSWTSTDYSSDGAREALHGQALTEGRMRGFLHAPEREMPRAFFPADAVAPF